MKLYHGTSTRCLPSIQKHGLRPRTGGDSNWAKNPSHPEMVYLTTAYPFYYAPNADDSMVVVFEINAEKLDEKRLFPDEDFVVYYANMHRKEPLTEAQKQRVCADLDLFQKHWFKSVAAMGNCAYRGTIPLKAISRYCLFDTAARPELNFYFADASINLLNYRLQGKEFEQAVSWMFGDRKLLPMVAEAETMESRQLWLVQSKDRTGIEVVAKT